MDRAVLGLNYSFQFLSPFNSFEDVMNKMYSENKNSMTARWSLLDEDHACLLKAPAQLLYGPMSLV